MWEHVCREELHTFTESYFLVVEGIQNLQEVSEIVAAELEEGAYLFFHELHKLVLSKDTI